MPPIKKHKERPWPLLLAVFLIAPFFISSQSAASDGVTGRGEDIIAAGDFSRPVVYGPKLWSNLYFPRIKRHTRYTVVRDKDNGYLRARANASASALYRPIDFDLAAYPILSWRWKIEGVLDKGDARTKAGDDYAARIYVTFAFEPKSAGYLEAVRFQLGKRLFGREPPGSAINYIWANKLKKGNSVPNPYTNHGMMIAVESGEALAGTWVQEERNVFEDYIKTFGRKPPRITGIAIMTDSDNTGTKATGYYADIVFRKKPSPKQ